MPKYAYLCFPAQMIYEIHDWTARLQLPDEGAYLAADAHTLALITALEEGYRWIRTEGDMAIFEKEEIRSCHSSRPGRNANRRRANLRPIASRR